MGPHQKVKESLLQRGGHESRSLTGGGGAGEGALVLAMSGAGPADSRPRTALLAASSLLPTLTATRATPCVDRSLEGALPEQSPHWTRSLGACPPSPSRGGSCKSQHQSQYADSPLTTGLSACQGIHLGLIASPVLRPVGPGGAAAVPTWHLHPEAAQATPGISSSPTPNAAAAAPGGLLSSAAAFEAKHAAHAGAYSPGAAR